MSEIKLIVGLGNPGDKYADTRHNAGEWLINRLARQFHFSLTPES
ncbi:TPA: aminoacyl-tRNA hydrolase, partial [Pasteurella multocida]|nr:aminoacyl-tRNA hydrolase [Pasteurella multocida]